MIKLNTIIVLVFCCVFNAKSQEPNCNRTLLHDYVIDGQEYLLKLEDSKTGKIYMNFFDGFQYRIALCSPTTKKYKITLFDIEKKMLFSGSCDDYSRSIDLYFSSNMACYAEIVTDTDEPKQQFIVVIGFKEGKPANSH